LFRRYLFSTFVPVICSGIGRRIRYPAVTVDRPRTRGVGTAKRRDEQGAAAATERLRIHYEFMDALRILGGRRRYIAAMGAHPAITAPRTAPLADVEPAARALISGPK
jgi:hypothetical protein